MPMLKYRDKFIVAGLDKSVDHALQKSKIKIYSNA
jgi:hypothetical protein